MLKAGIIGTGSIARVHLEAYRKQNRRCRVCTLYNRTNQKAAEFAAQNNLEKVLICRDIDEFIRAKPDLVSICTPPSSHAGQAVLCLENNISVILEKPMASSLEECDKILQAEKNSAGLLSVVAQNRFVSGHWKLKQILDSGLAGKINYIGVNSSWWRGLKYYDMYWRSKWQNEGGGCTLNHAVHHIDLLLWYAGMPEKVKAFISNTSHPNSEVEDLSAAVFSWKSGALGQLQSSLVHHGEEKQIIIQCENALLSDPWKTAASLDRGDGFPVPDIQKAEQIQSYYESLEEPEFAGMDGRINDVINAIEKGNGVLIDGNSARNAMELITSIYNSHFLDRTEILPLAFYHPFYTKEGILENTERIKRSL